MQRLLHPSSRGALPDIHSSLYFLFVGPFLCGLQHKDTAQVRVKGEIKPVQPSFYDDIIRLPDIIEKVLQAKRPNMLPSRWVSCRRGRCVLWRKFSPILDLGSFTRTCGGKICHYYPIANHIKFYINYYLSLSVKIR